ncbi:MAG TPA: HAMP domain-containing sensor histidine kinase [Clostridia bacterium]|nr:HAMP domain-containing sensor histidine kinase [Clostridia bacterium]HPQ46415.1 HAMP domain-containing sensor histidine kinase [Clostridia bacterium]HRX42037.1 HAMP domain-containing sensor histidine kinase [Clostridia bacterium]
MFRKLQLKLILVYTSVLMAILLVSNILIYVSLSSFNENRLADDIERILVDIEGSEWTTPTYDENIRPVEEDDEEEEHNTPEPTVTPSPNESIEDTKNHEDDDSAEDDEDDDDDESSHPFLMTGRYLVMANGNLSNYISLVSSAAPNEPEQTTAPDTGTVTFSDNTELYIPNILNSFGFYFIYSNDGELLEWKSSDSNLLNKMYTISLSLESGNPPELIDLTGQGNGIYLVVKRPIMVDGRQMGYYSIGEDVSAAYDTLDNLRLIMILVTIAGLFISIGIGYLFAGRVIKPIKEAYKTKENFIGDASHELRIPLSIILLSLELLKKRNDGHDPQNMELVSDVEAETLNMKRLVENLLFIARTDSKSIEPKFETVDLSKVLDNNIEKFRTLRPEKNLEYHKAFSDGLTINGDSQMIDSMVSILIDNAEKYNKTDGEIFVEADVISRGKKEFICMKVRDTGIGIPEKDLGRIFERFHRQDRSRSRDIPGYGLGLSMAKEIIQLHKGTIDVKSQENEGTEFTVMLPHMV